MYRKKIYKYKRRPYKKYKFTKQIRDNYCIKLHSLATGFITNVGGDDGYSVQIFF